MAAIVEISKTNHLTFSPLNEKHNILYYRARQYINQRHIQKPWFDLNPFLDKEDDKGIDLDTYRPEHDRGVQPLESLTIVEDYFSEYPLLTKEFKIADFWDFLFSDDWADGYSLRILEGRLQNLIMSCVVSMAQSGKLVHHSTRAYAKNRRKRFAVYKHSAKPPEIGRHEETLLLEFIYYGHVVRTPGHEAEDGSSAGYAQTTTCSTATNCTSISSDLESDQENKAVVVYNKGSDRTDLDKGMKPSPPCLPKPSQQRQKLLKKRVTRTSQSSVQDKMLVNKSLSRVQEVDHRFAMIPRGTTRQDHRSDVSSGSEDYSYAYVPQKLDLSKFMCTERVSYLGEFDLSDDSSSSSDDDEDSDYGQGLYIGERGIVGSPVPIESVEAKLKKRKSQVKKNRQLRRQIIEEARKPHKPIVPELSELDVKKYLSSANIDKGNDTNTAEKVPDLAEYIKMLKEDDMNDPRLAKESKRRRMKFMKKYNIIKPKNEEFADTVGGITDSQACRLHCYGTDSVWQVMSDQTKKKFLIQKLLQAGGKVQPKTKKKTKRGFLLRKKVEIPLIYITTISGITYMHPVSRPILEKRRQEEQKTKQIPAPPTRRRMLSIALGEPSALLAELNKRRRPSLQADSTTDTFRATIPVFPKAKPFVSGMESPDFDSEEEESDGLTDSPFDTTKLHMRYSLERIRKNKAEKRRMTRKEEPQFVKVLKKYYRMQSILKAFTPNERRKSSAGFRHSISGSLPMMRPRQRKLKRNVLNAMKLDERDELRIGKMKWFSFLETKRKLVEPTDDTDEPLFENYPMDLFREHVERALDEFVVRREVVISDYNAKASISITMTKKSVFVKSKASF